MAAWWNPTSWGWVKALTNVRETVPDADYGADYGGDYARAPAFLPSDAMSAYCRFPWLYAPVSRRAADMAGLPMVLTQGDPTDPTATRVDAHAVLDLMAMPSSNTTGEELRRQLAVDLQLNGNAYLLLVGPRQPTSIIRLHPESVRIVPQRHSPVVQAYQYSVGDGAVNYAPSRIIHIRYPSWEAGPAGLYGQGVVRALKDDLETELNAKEHSKKMSAQGRPDVVLSPGKDGETWGPRARAQVKEAYGEMVQGGGPIISGGSLKFDFLALKPRDMEYIEQHKNINAAIMAATQTPPVVLGLETANYATAKQQYAIYWGGILHDSRLIDAALTIQLARLWRPGLTLRHDFSGVEAMQVDRTDKVTRAHLHIAAGATPAAAYAYEGLGDAPVSAEALSHATAPVEAPPEETASLSRKARHVEWLAKAHTPSENRLREAVRRYQREAAARYAAAVERALRDASKGLRVVGDGGADVMVKAPDLTFLTAELEAEMAQMSKRVGPSWLRSWLLAAEAAAATLPIEGLVFETTDPGPVRALHEFLKPTSKATSEAVRMSVERGLAENATIGEIKASIMDASAFGRSRALRIARTEATRATNLGGLAAAERAADQGLTIMRVWSTAADEAVRDSHITMDGQERGMGEPFTSGDGNSALHPGGFAEAGESINCRCQVENRVVGGVPSL